MGAHAPTPCDGTSSWTRRVVHDARPSAASASDARIERGRNEVTARSLSPRRTKAESRPDVFVFVPNTLQRMIASQHGMPRDHSRRKARFAIHGFFRAFC